MKHLSKLLVLATCIPFVALAQQDPAPQPVDERNLPEEVVITGSRALQQLRTQMLEAEKAAYQVFNQFNDEKRFNITCSEHEYTGSHFRKQDCVTEFEIQATSAHGRQYLESYQNFIDAWISGGRLPVTDGSPPPPVPYQALITEGQREFRKKLRQVAEEHPEFLAAIVHYSEIQQRYKRAIETSRKSH